MVIAIVQVSGRASLLPDGRSGMDGASAGDSGGNGAGAGHDVLIGVAMTARGSDGGREARVIRCHAPNKTPPWEPSLYCRLTTPMLSA